MRITSRNVNWIRAVINKWFEEWIKRDNPDILCIQEPKAFEHQIPAEIKFIMKDYNYIRHSGTKPWYAGTAIFYKKNLEILDTKNHFGELEHFHEDGRVVEVKFSIPLSKRDKGGFNVTLLNIYFPNGGTKADGTEMLSYKLEFYEKFIRYINTLRENWENVITTWDFNICHNPIDIARPEENKNSIWFLPIERAELDKLQANGYVDVFRHFNPELKDKYTRRSYRAWARPRNVWRRLDYFRVSENILPLVSKIEHQEQVMWSDHCPISLELNL